LNASLGSSALKASLRTAAADIRRFCESQKPVEWTRCGIAVGQIVRPLGVGWLLRSGRTPSADPDAADDRDPRHLRNV